MKSYNSSELIVTGLGVTSAVGQGKKDFTSALLQGKSHFDIMKREGRQRPLTFSQNGIADKESTAFLGAEIDSLTIPQSISKSLLRTASFSSQVALTTLEEAWNDAGLKEVESERIGLVVGGSNFQQRELLLAQEKYRNKVQFVRPTYGMSFMDSDLCGLCSESFGIKGLAYTIGGASASGQVAILQAIQTILSGQVDVCIVIGALMDLSYLECKGFHSLGAMGSDRYADMPSQACRPFDQDRNGFIFGESCGAIVIEKANTTRKFSQQPYAKLSGWGMAMDGNRNPNPSFEGEVSAINRALECAGIDAKDIDYVNPHGTGSTIGDEIELESLRHCHLNEAYINATKSVIGHGLSAAGAVEVIATLLQMKEESLHPTLNLTNPIDPSFKWVRQNAISHRIEKAINLSMGFGGVNTAICLQRL